MKIVFHCVYFPPEVGGLESHVFYLCRALAGMGHSVEVVTSRSLPGLPQQEEMDGIRVWRTWFPSRSPTGWIAHSLASVPTLMERASDADILHAQAFASVLPCLFAASTGGRRIPVVSTLHTSHFLVRARKAAWKPVLRELVRRPDHSLAASEEIAAVGETLAPGVKVEALTNGVETDRFKPVLPALPPRTGPRIVVPRWMFEKNGVEYLVRAIPAIRVAHPDVEVLLVGDGPERVRLEGLAGGVPVPDGSHVGRRSGVPLLPVAGGRFPGGGVTGDRGRFGGRAVRAWRSRRSGSGGQRAPGQGGSCRAGSRRANSGPDPLEQPATGPATRGDLRGAAGARARAASPRASGLIPFHRVSNIQKRVELWRRHRENRRRASERPRGAQARTSSP